MLLGGRVVLLPGRGCAAFDPGFADCSSVLFRGAGFSVGVGDLIVPVDGLVVVMVWLPRFSVGVEGVKTGCSTGATLGGVAGLEV